MGNWRFSKLKGKKHVIGVRVIGVSVPMKKRVFGVHQGCQTQFRSGAAWSKFILTRARK